MVRDKFQNHAASGETGAFAPDAEDNLQLSQLTRDLEKKRQEGRLTDDEVFTLSQIDKLQEDIAKHSLKPARGESIAAVSNKENIYDLDSSRIRPEPPVPEPAMAPKITSIQASEIIDGINTQFVDKVLKKLKDRVEIPEKHAWEVQDFKVPVAAANEGENLSDYLAKMRVGARD